MQNLIINKNILDMKTRNRLIVKFILILSTLLFVGWGLKNKKEIDNTKNIIVLIKYKTQPSKEPHRRQLL